MFWHSSWSWARNSLELIDSTTGVVLAPEVQPGPHQIIGTVDGTDVFAGPYITATCRYAGAMGIK